LVVIDLNDVFKNINERLSGVILKSNLCSERKSLYMVCSSLVPVDINSAQYISAISEYIVKPIGVARLKTITNRLLEA
jgi:hypothetical protein